jgi:hypothetical protein
MLLVLGHPDDLLIQQVYSRAAGDAIPIHCIDEPDLFASVPFAFEQNGTSTTGYLSITETGSNAGTTLRLNQLSGVLVRLPRLWWPSTDLDLQDQMFVYHECSAAWFALLEALSCPVVNRFDLAWWLNDITYPAALVHDLAHKLNIHADTPPSPSALPPRILPKPPEPNCSSVYLAGSTLIPRSSKDHAISNWLAKNLSTLTTWQRENGAQLSRLDFDLEATNPEGPTTLCLHHVELFPWLEDEPPALIDQIAAATVEMLT